MSKHLSFFVKYISYLRRSSQHVQEMHAIFFSVIITSCILVAILYFEYDFWKPNTPTPTHHKEETYFLNSTEEDRYAPYAMFSSFIEEARIHFKNIQEGGSVLLESKESYYKE